MDINEPDIHKGFAVIRSDRAPNDWWDGYYYGIEGHTSGLKIATAIAQFWTEELGVPCYAIETTCLALPHAGWHGRKEISSRAYGLSRGKKIFSFNEDRGEQAKATL